MAEVETTLFGASLSSAWASFVSQGLIKSRCRRTEDNAELEMGLRLNADGAVEEFARLVDGGDLFDPASTPDRRVGPFVVRVVGFRAFRPNAGGMVSMCAFEPHSCVTCSLCGSASPYRLQLREPLLQLRTAAEQAGWCAAHAGAEVPDWTAHYNIAPCERAGHVLLVPRLVDHPRVPDTTVGKGGSRGEQRLLETDCAALVSILSNSRGLSITYNSERAGASQNHIHAQGWASAAWRGTAVAGATRELVTRCKGGGVIETLPSYPAFAAVLTAPTDAALTAALWRLVQRLQGQGTPFNLFMECAHGALRGDFMGPIIYMFVRDASKEITSAFANLKFAGCHCAGLVLLDCPFDRIEAEWASATEERITAGLRETTVPRPEGLALLRNVFTEDAG